MKNKPKSKPKKALITGVTGQDGSYLAELLISKGYEVHGIMRRVSVFTTERIEHIYQDPHEKRKKFTLHYGDLADANTIRKLIYKVQPDEIYNIAAQSHVKVSFDLPEYTAEITGVGVLRMLEAIKDYQEDTKRKVKFYQASSSEMFGATNPPQNENSPFYPRSPYGCAKVFAFHTVRNYREAYGIFAVNGILFNHETIASFIPMFCKEKGNAEFNIKPIREIVRFDEEKKEYQAKPVSGVQVLGKDGWVDVKYASAYPHDVNGDNKKPRFINSRSGAFMATASHVVFMDGGKEKDTGKIEVGDRLEIVSLPNSPSKEGVGLKEAELTGMMVGDGSISYEKKGIGVHGKFINSSAEIRNRFNYLWEEITGGKTNYYPGRSGFNPGKIVGYLGLSGGNDWLRSLDLYNADKTKRVPKKILNSSINVMLAFLRGYNVADGLKANPCTYEFKNFKTNSATLAMGLWYLIEKTTNQEINLTVETKDDGRIFYSLNILSPTDNFAKEERVLELVSSGVSQRGIFRETGISRTFIRKIQRGGLAQLIHHLKKDPAEVKKIIDLPRYDGWFYDLETSSGEFHCGIGKIHVHNSPRRGKTFVTKKITTAVSRIVAGLDKKIYLGNLDAKRDWGYAPEYVEAMWKMLQQKKPEDFVIGSGKAYTVGDFVKEAFVCVGIKDWKKYVGIDKKYYRPTEVDYLEADTKKSKKQLGWKCQTSFKDLVKIMMKYDLEEQGLSDKAKKIKVNDKYSKSGKRWFKDEAKR